MIKEFKAIALMIVSLLVAYLSTIHVPLMWVNVGALEIIEVIFVFCAYWNLKETFEL